MSMEFGDPMKDEFCLDKSVTFINHGSYGPAPKSVFEQRIKYLREQENQPDLWFRFRQPKLYQDSLCAAAKFLGAKKENLALVENVTTGLNTVVKSLSLKAGDKIMINSHTYNAVKNIAFQQRDLKGVEVVTVEIEYPIKSEEDFVDLFRKAFEKHKNIKLHIFDHITSSSAIRFPVEKLIKLAKEYGALSLIDGAHAAGQVEMNLEELNPDFYSGNFHKWCYVPRSCGFLWISPKHAGKIQPLVTSHGYKQGLDEEFSFLGTRDCTNIFCLPQALKFHQDVGGLKAIQDHADEVLTYGCKLLAESLGTEEADIPKSMKAPYMRLIRLPIDKPAELEIVDEMTKELITKFQAQAIFTACNGNIYIRPSCNVYNEKSDFVKLNDALVKFVDSIS